MTGPDSTPRTVVVSTAFSLAQTCGPVAWGGGRWPNLDWRQGALWWVGWEGDEIVWRRVRQTTCAVLDVEGTGDSDSDRDWAERILGIADVCPGLGDPVVARLGAKYSRLRSFSHGSLFDGLITSIVGQSISVAAAAVTEARLCALFSPAVKIGGRSFWPLPRAEDLANSDAARVRESGVTWRRAEAIVQAGRERLTRQWPTIAAARADPGQARIALAGLPLVGPWTLASTLLWGIGAADAYPAGDVALLRAVRRAYHLPDLTLKGMDTVAEGWRPARGWAARLLWTDLLGIAPESNCSPVRG